MLNGGAGGLKVWLEVDPVFGEVPVLFLKGIMPSAVLSSWADWLTGLMC